MTEQIESTGTERTGLINSLIVVSFCIAMLMLWPTYPLLAGIIFYTPTVIFLYCNREKIIIVGNKKEQHNAALYQ